jgi:hypothetical protein
MRGLPLDREVGLASELGRGGGARRRVGGGVGGGAVDLKFDDEHASSLDGGGAGARQRARRRSGGDSERTAAIIDGASVDGRVSAGGRRAPISSIVIPGTEPRNRRAWPRIESAKEQGMRDREGRDRGDGYGTEGGRARP